jgi:hypothetical protein
MAAVARIERRGSPNIVIAEEDVPKAGAAIAIYECIRGNDLESQIGFFCKSCWYS